MRSALLWLTLAACSSDGSVELRVLPPSATDKPVTDVELYVGIYDPHPDAVRPARGETSNTVWWKRDPNRIQDAQPMTAEGALFAFEGGATDSVAAVVAVGLATDNLGNKVPVASSAQLVPMDIPDNEVHRYELQLGHFDALPRPDGSVAQAPGLQIWGPPDDPRHCVMIDNVPDLAAYSGADSAMIVGAHDPDCDGAPDDDPLECQPREFMSGTPITRQSLNCVVDETYGATPGCVVGGPACVDTIGTTDCAPSNYCTSTKLCAAGCDNGACEDAAALLQVARLDCPMPYVTSNGSTFCSNIPVLIALNDNGAPLGPLVGDDSLPPLIRRFQQPFGSSVSYAQDMVQVQIEAKAASLAQYVLTVSGMSLLSTTTDGAYVGAVAIPLASPVNRGLALPVIFHPTLVGSDCNATDFVGTCQLTFPSGGTDPGIKACLGAPVRPEQIATD